MRVIDALEAAGFEAWVVGGWVRDALLGRAGHDVDVTTSAPWQQTAAVLRAAGSDRERETGVRRVLEEAIGAKPEEHGDETETQRDMSRIGG